MASPSKQKGNAFEREIVNLAKEFGLKAVRAWGSNGQSLGLHEEVDCTREDRGDTYALMDINIFLTLLKRLKGSYHFK